MHSLGLAVRRMEFLAILPGMAMIFALAMVGCGSAEEAMDEEFGSTPTAQLESRIDSLVSENRKLRDQVEAVTGENRRLTARNAELETKVAEAMATAQAAPPAAPSQAPAPAPAPVAGGSDAGSAYEAALSQYNGKNYQGALDQFQALLNSGTAGKLADNCRYWIGESYYGLGKYSDALSSFRQVIEKKGSSKIPYALLMIGNCEALLGNKDAAREAYSKVTAQYPTSPVAGKARARLSKLQ